MRIICANEKATRPINLLGAYGLVPYLSDALWLMSRLLVFLDS